MKNELKKQHATIHRDGFFPTKKAEKGKQTPLPADDASTRLFREALKTLKTAEREALFDNAVVLGDWMRDDVDHDGRGLRRKRGYILFVEICEPWA